MAILPIEINREDKILLIAPHPDDECIGTGGVLSIYADQCDVVVVTDGRQGNSEIIPQTESIIRKEQFESEMNYLGISSYKWLGYYDGELMSKTGCFDDIDFLKYTKIFIPWGDDNHPDHTATYLLVADKIGKELNSRCEVYMYEVHVPFRDVTHYLDISEVIEEKIKLIQFHMDQISQIPYDEIVKALNKYRACQAFQVDKYYETYVKLNYGEINSLSGIVEKRETEIQKFKQFYRLLIEWVNSYQNKQYLVDYLKSNNIKTVSVYGYAELGKLVINELKGSSIEIIEILDKRELQSVTVNPSYGQRVVDAVIVTAVFYFDDIKEELVKLGYKNVLSLQEIIYMLNDKQNHH